MTVRDNQRTIHSDHVRTETKHSLKTTELPIYVLAVLGVLIASAVTDAQDFGPQEAWQYVTWLTIGYLLSRGLAKSGSRATGDDDARTIASAVDK